MEFLFWFKKWQFDINPLVRLPQVSTLYIPAGRGWKSESLVYLDYSYEKLLKVLVLTLSHGCININMLQLML